LIFGEIKMDENIHDGVVSLYVECTNPNDREYCTGTPVEGNILKKYNLNPGDEVQYEITKNRGVKIIGKISKVYTPI
jgi:hypothetical protein